jgi:AcrR family transcriptional regulator
MARKNSHERILDAAEDIVAQTGAGHLTLDAVAEKAGVSKGGLMYHFPSKESLLYAMIERLVAGMEAGQAARADELPPGKARSIKAHVLNFPRRNARRKKFIALLAAAAYDPRLLAPARKAYRKMFERFVADGVRPARAAVIAFAMDGIRLTELLNITPVSPGLREKVTQELLRLADEDA